MICSIYVYLYYIQVYASLVVRREFGDERLESLIQNTAHLNTNGLKFTWVHNVSVVRSENFEYAYIAGTRRLIINFAAIDHNLYSSLVY